MTSEDRIKTLESQIEKLQAKQAELRKQLAEAELDRWRGRVDDLELQMHLASMEVSERVQPLVEKLRDRVADARDQMEGNATVATEGITAVRDSLQTAFKDIRKAVLDATKKIAS